MIVSILEGHVTSERWNAFETAYSKGIKHIPTQLLQSFLIQDNNDQTLWRVISIWRSKQDFDEIKASGVYNTCVDMYRAVGVEPTRRVFRVVAHHQHV